MDQFVNSFYFIEKCRVCESEDKYIDLLKNINLLENFENLADQKVSKFYLKFQQQIQRNFP